MCITSETLILQGIREKKQNKKKKRKKDWARFFWSKRAVINRLPTSECDFSNLVGFPSTLEN